MGSAGDDGGVLKGREVLLCATGGIACYKAADLASKLVQAGAGVTAAMSDAAQRFVAPLTFQTLTGRKTYTTLWTPVEGFSSEHVSLTDRAELLIVAPATADIMAKIAAGIADDLVSTLVLAAWKRCPILAAPAMNTRMWEAPPTAANVARLREWGVHFVGPADGRLACGATGPGRMAEAGEILHAAVELLARRQQTAIV